MVNRLLIFRAHLFLLHLVGSAGLSPLENTRTTYFLFSKDQIITVCHFVIYKEAKLKIKWAKKAFLDHFHQDVGIHSRQQK